MKTKKYNKFSAPKMRPILINRPNISTHKWLIDTDIFACAYYALPIQGNEMREIKKKKKKIVYQS